MNKIKATKKLIAELDQQIKSGQLTQDNVGKLFNMAKPLIGDTYEDASNIYFELSDDSEASPVNVFACAIGINPTIALLGDANEIAELVYDEVYSQNNI